MSWACFDVPGRSKSYFQSTTWERTAVLTLSVPVGLDQFVSCIETRVLVRGGFWRRGWAQSGGGAGVYLGTVCRSTRVWCHIAAASGRWSGRRTRRRPGGRRPRSYPRWRTSPPAQRPGERGTFSTRQTPEDTYRRSIGPLPGPKAVGVSLIQAHPEPAARCSKSNTKQDQNTNSGWSLN